ncbi:MAG: hypothetical protein WDA75_09000 [Candidatus Latescibacterota bacterium]|jgi:hypothetical protein
MSDGVLQDGIFPIVGWAGPGGEMIRDEVMAGMAEAGFTVSHSAPAPDLEAVKRALDVAQAHGVRLLLVHPAWHVGDDFALTEAHRQEIVALVRQVREHPGLYGYHLRDEPAFRFLPPLAEVSDLIRGEDPYHLIYINHFPPIRGWGAPTVEWFWREYIRLARPRMLSYDHYPITIGTDEEIARTRDLPNVFPDGKIVVKPDYYSCLELLRTLSADYRIPFWAFTCAVRHGPYPTPTEGHLRYQLFSDLAYGAQGLQYFTYAHDQAMVRPDGSTTETWEMARRINREVHTWGPWLLRLRNVGTFHHGPQWSGTRPLPSSDEPLSVAVEGDPAIVGFFLDPEERLHLLVTNANPCAWARLTLKVKVDQEKLYYVDPRDGVVRLLWPPNPRAQLVVLAPGEARLFQVGGEGQGQNF